MSRCALCGCERRASDLDYVDLNPDASLAFCRRGCKPTRKAPVEPPPLPWDYAFNPRTQRFGRGA